MGTYSSELVINCDVDVRNSCFDKTYRIYGIGFYSTVAGFYFIQTCRPNWLLNNYLHRGLKMDL